MISPERNFFIHHFHSFKQAIPIAITPVVGHDDGVLHRDQLAMCADVFHWLKVCKSGGSWDRSLYPAVAYRFVWLNPLYTYLLIALGKYCIFDQSNKKVNLYLGKSTKTKKS